MKQPRKNRCIFCGRASAFIDRSEFSDDEFYEADFTNCLGQNKYICDNCGKHWWEIEE